MTQQYSPGAENGIPHSSGPVYFSPYYQHGVQQPAYTPPEFIQSQVNPIGGYNSSSGTNFHRFESNSQIYPSGPPLQFPPSTFSSDLLKQYASSNIPFPPPPPPITSLSPTAFGLMSSSTPIHAHGSLISNVDFSNNPIRLDHLIPDMNNSKNLPTGKGSLETALEMSKGNPNGGTIVPDFSPAQSMSQQNLPYETAASYFVDKYPQAQFNSGHADRPSIDDQHLRQTSSAIPAAPSGLFRTEMYTKQPSPIPTNGSNATEALMELRQLAKSAILSMLPHNIYYRELVEEGVDPSVLDSLYAELGIDVRGLNRQKQAVNSPGESQQRLGLDKQIYASGKTDIIADDIPHVNSADTSLVKPQQPIAPSKHHEPVVKAPITTESDRRISPSGNDIIPPERQAELSPALERKDRIAQLLAAKTGRPNPSSKSPGSSSGADPVTNIVSLDAPINHRDNQLKPHILKHKNAQQTGMGDESIDVEADSVIQQSELLTYPKQAPTNLILTQPYSAQSLPPVNTTAPGKLRNSALLHTIPGLFLTSAEASVERNSPVNLSTKLTEPEIVQNSHDSETDVSTENGLSSNSNVDLPKNGSGQSSALEILSQNFRIPSKRPKASDTFDEELEPLPKRSHNESQEEGDDDEVMENIVDAEVSEGEIVESDEDDARAVYVPASKSLTSQRNGQYLSEQKDSRITDQQILPSTETQTDAIAYPVPTESPGQVLYEAKQSEIEIMRKRIAEMESRKQSKPGSTKNDSIQSTLMDSSPAPGLTPNPISSPAEISSETLNRENLASVSASKPSPSISISRLTPAQLAEKAAALKAGLLKQRASRQKLLQESLPDLNAEVQKTKDKLSEMRSRLDQIRQEAERHESEALHARNLEQQVINEASRLEQQLQEGLSGQKQYSDELQNLQYDQHTSIASHSVQSQGSNNLSNGLNDDHYSSKLGQNRSLGSLIDQGVNPTPVSAEQGRLVITSDETKNLVSKMSPVPSTSIQSKDDELTSVMKPETNILQDDIHLGKDSVFRPASISSSHEALRDEVRLGTLVETDIPIEENLEPSRLSSMDIDEDVEGSVSMSDSGSDEEYDPIETEAGFISEQVTDAAETESEEYSPEKSPVQDEERMSVSEEDDTGEYEPTEGFDSHLDSGLQNEQEATTTHNIPDLVPEQNLEPSTLEVDKVDATEHNHQPKHAKHEKPIHEALDYIVDPLVPLSGDTKSGKARFIPYQSPLQSLKTFRFHPDFNETVRNGYRSLTYSNNINWNRPLCPTELAGETCVDPTCEEQHFRQLGLTDDKILVQMSSTNDIGEKEQRDRYLAGLKQVIATLRQNGVKEFENVANALSAYRREFFAEPEIS